MGNWLNEKKEQINFWKTAFALEFADDYRKDIEAQKKQMNNKEFLVTASMKGLLIAAAVQGIISMIPCGQITKHILKTSLTIIFTTNSVCGKSIYHAFKSANRVVAYTKKG